MPTRARHCVDARPDSKESLVTGVSYFGPGLELLIVLLAMTLPGPLWLVVAWRSREAKVGRRLTDARRRALGQPIESPATRQSGIVALFSAVGSAITASGLLSSRTRAELEQTLRAGGLTISHNLELFLGSKIILSFGAPCTVFLTLRHSGIAPMMVFVLVSAAAVVGLMLPNMIIGQRRKMTLKEIGAGLADGLDMMVICAEAGLALEAAIQRVSVEVVHAHPKLAAEFAVTYSELSISADPRTALSGMGTRTGLDSLKRLSATLTQSIQYGTPLSAALRSLAAELRQETLTRFEERAAKLPVLLTLPMILFILPCVFLIVAGPIVVQVLKAMHP